mmetsp:Transcript_35696/g.54900  ORF Transcript_35696/g.54900 Transcript_35696/m.54900 type:complete len:155 (+) Transcript_35696:1485-1949(+)
MGCMYGFYNAWPHECTQAPMNLDDGSPVYSEMKPIADGNMTIGLYTDTRCAVEYQGDLLTEEVLSDLAINVNGDNDKNQDDEYENWNAGLILGKSWNNAMSIYKVCQPCRAYNLQMNYVNGNNNRKRKLDDNYGPKTDTLSVTILLVTLMLINV